MLKPDNVVKNKSKAFAIRIVNLYKYLCETKKEFVISKQILRSGTSIGANIAEALCGTSKKDFQNKMHISFKECAETKYWLELLHDTSYINDDEFSSMDYDCTELIKHLCTITKSVLRNISPKGGHSN